MIFPGYDCRWTVKHTVRYPAKPVRRNISISEFAREGIFHMLATQDDMIIPVKHAQAGNIEAFDILMQNYEREIFRYLVGLR